ncbi:MAG: bacteriorhodopsin-like [Bacteroidota bacterium]
MDLINLVPDLFLATIRQADYVGFTFFIGSMAMMAATVFFFVQMTRVEGKWKDSMLVAGLITFIAAVHYFYMREYWTENQSSPTEFRYIDWILTVPLMCVEFYLILRAVGATTGLLWKMIGYSVLMLVAGYIGEAVDPGNTVMWGIISTVGYVGILYEAWAGSARKLAANASDPALLSAIKALGWFVFAGWAIYPIGYMCMEGGWLEGVLPATTLDLFYNIGDAINKIGFGLVIYGLAVSAKKSTATA